MAGWFHEDFAEVRKVGGQDEGKSGIFATVAALIEGSGTDVEEFCPLELGFRERTDSVISDKVIVLLSKKY